MVAKVMAARMRDRLGRFIGVKRPLRTLLISYLSVGLGLKRFAFDSMDQTAIMRLVAYRCVVLLVIFSCTVLLVFASFYGSGNQWGSILKCFFIGFGLFSLIYILEYLIWFHDQIPVFYDSEDAQRWFPSRAGVYTLIIVVGILTVFVIPLTAKLRTTDLAGHSQIDDRHKRLENLIISDFDRVKSEYNSKTIILHDRIASAAIRSGVDITSMKMEGMDIERRALIIALSKYQSSPLEGVSNDALLMKKTLEKAGYIVTVAIDKSKDEIEKTVVAYGSMLSPKALSVVYIAGHGIQEDNINYLLPLESKGDASQPFSPIDQYISLNHIVNRLIERKGGARYNLFIFDACRSFIESSGGRAKLGGLAKFNNPDNKLGIVTSADSGQVALDKCTSCRGHGPFAFALSKHFGRPIAHDEMIKAVKREVGILLSDQDKGRVQIPSFTDYADRSYVMASSAKRLTVGGEAQVRVDKGKVSDELGECYGIDVENCLRALRDWSNDTERQIDSFVSRTTTLASEIYHPSLEANEFLGNGLQYWRTDRKAILIWLALWASLSALLWVLSHFSSDAIRQYHMSIYRRSRWIIKHTHFFVDEYISLRATDSSILSKLDSNWDVQSDFYPKSDRKAFLVAVNDPVGARDHVEFARSVGLG